MMKHLSMAPGKGFAETTAGIKTVFAQARVLIQAVSTWGYSYSGEFYQLECRWSKISWHETKSYSCFFWGGVPNRVLRHLALSCWLEQLPSLITRKTLKKGDATSTGPPPRLRLDPCRNSSPRDVVRGNFQAEYPPPKLPVAEVRAVCCTTPTFGCQGNQWIWRSWSPGHNIQISNLKQALNNALCFENAVQICSCSGLPNESQY